MSPIPAPEGAGTTAPVPAIDRPPPATDTTLPATARISMRPLAPLALPEQPPVPGMTEAPRPAHQLSRSIPVTVRPGDRNETDEHCRAITVKAQLGEEPSDDDRAYLRRGCARR